MPSCNPSIVTPDAKKPREAGLFVSEWINRSTCLGDVGRLRSFLALNYLEFDLIALSERLETRSTDCAEMDKDVRASLS
jgi:hypothetical protein